MVGQDLDQPAVIQSRLQEFDRLQQDAEARERRVQQRFPMIDHQTTGYRHDGAPFWAVESPMGPEFCMSEAKAFVLLEVSRRQKRRRFGKIGGRRAEDEPIGRQGAPDETAVGQLADTEGYVIALVDQIYGAVAERQVDGHLRVIPEELR